LSHRAVIVASKEQQKVGVAGGRCPICKKPTDTAYRPFCSARCRDVDLSRWLRGGYAIPGAEPAGEEHATSRDQAGTSDEADED
jgi:endogenous inhibitor of DNA gyrase (YacG/DUF329 family)